MSTKGSFHFNMRLIHRYLGFFLAGIMAVYALSGVVLIFRSTDFLKTEKKIEKTILPSLDKSNLGEALGIKSLVVTKEDSSTYFFKEGTYSRSTGRAIYTVTKLPFFLDKMTRLHKAKTSDPLYFLNIFFGISLLFFVISSFWMFMPKTSVFKKGLYFTFAGIVLTLALLFIK